ncbi:uncharacterized protein METZ01_LOCUS95936, partial [marine metagenome]
VAGFTSAVNIPANHKDCIRVLGFRSLEGEAGRFNQCLRHDHPRPLTFGSFAKHKQIARFGEDECAIAYSCPLSVILGKNLFRALRGDDGSD